MDTNQEASKEVSKELLDILSHLIEGEKFNKMRESYERINDFVKENVHNGVISGKDYPQYQQMLDNFYYEWKPFIDSFREDREVIKLRKKQPVIKLGKKQLVIKLRKKTTKKKRQ